MRSLSCAMAAAMAALLVGTLSSHATAEEVHAASPQASGPAGASIFPDAVDEHEGPLSTAPAPGTRATTESAQSTQPTPQPAIAPTAAPPPEVPAVTETSSAMTEAFADWNAGPGDDEAWRTEVEAFYGARGGVPLWYADGVINERGRALLAELAKAGDWGLDASAYRVAPPLENGKPATAMADVRLTFALIRYARDAQNGRIDPATLSRWLEATAKPFTAGEVLAKLSNSADPSAALVGYHPPHEGFAALRKAYLAIRDARQPGKRDLLDRIRANLERWRWLPADLGTRHVWNNIPAFETKLVDGGRTIFQERLVVGTPRTQTPVFSDRIRFIVFQPDWGVPPSLKVKDLLPRLAAGDTSVLERRDMRVVGRDVESYDWSKVDIRKVPIVQNPGPSNPLGQMKFMFPNRHDVYMHDTPSKYLFSERMRAQSNGCIRVRNPMRFAELLLEADKGWTRADLVKLTTPRSPANNKIDLAQPVPVHNVYFTVVADGHGGVAPYPDVYGHDRRVTDALNGEALAKIAARDPAVALEKEINRLMKTASNPVNRYSDEDAPSGQYGYSYGPGYGSPYSYGFGPPSAPPPPPKYNGGMPPWARAVFGFR